MSVVLVERSFAEPVAFEDFRGRGASCLELYRARFLRAYFSGDRLRMICLFEAPDAESVRVAQEKSGLPFEAAWTARVVAHGADVSDGEAIVVERTLAQPVDEAAILEAAARGAWCLEQRRSRSVSTYLSGDGRRVVCIYAGPDPEPVRQAQEQIGMPFDLAWPARVFNGRGASSEPAAPGDEIDRNASRPSNTARTWRRVGYVPLRKYSWIATSSGENSSTQRVGLPSRPPRPASCAYASSEPGT